MFQNFDTKAAPQQARPRLAALRTAMEQAKLDAFLVPHTDEYHSEYLPPCAQRLEWLTGFGGSAGFAVILRDKAALFVDGRYTLQVRQQTDPALFDYEDLAAMPPAVWLRQYLQEQAQAHLLPPAGALTIGFDPWLHSIKETDSLRQAIAPHGRLQAVTHNLADSIWHSRPSPPQGKISLQPLELAGRAAAEKLAAIRAKTRAAEAKACLLTDPAALAWAFNLRGRDVAHTPIALGFALVPVSGKATLFMGSDNRPAEVTAALAPLAGFAPRAAIAEHLTAYFKTDGALMADTALAAEAFRLLAEQAGGQIIAADDPVSLPRAIKTEAELTGARRAHLRDGVAMTRFLAWIDRQIAVDGAASLDEIKSAEALEAFRRTAAAEQGSRLEDISFDTISGAGANGAIIHYRVTRATNRRFRDGALYLVDSGGQYQDGTTDITRTIAIGAAGEEEKRCFTLVLKGMISLSLARFPQGARGRDLDSLARRALWQNGMDYAHGTGHGVGSFLSVHEGPQNISRAGAQELFANMIISNEPGYYREGAFGIRLENLLIVRGAEAVPGGDSPMLGFETLTLCPIDRRLIIPALLSAEELAWLNSYHAHVYESLAPFLDGEDKDRLAQATQKL